MQTFVIGGREVSFSDTYAIYGELRKQIDLEARQADRNFVRAYKNWGDIQTVISNIDDWFQERLYDTFMSCKPIALNYGAYDYGIPKLQNINYIQRKSLWSPYTTARDNIKSGLSKIDDYEASEEQRRAIRKESRTRIVGGGFGVSGAVKGMAVAGAINLGTGLAHGAFNMLGNMLTSMSASSDRDELYDSSMLCLRAGIRESLLNLLPIIANIINIRLDVDQQKEITILENIQNGSLDGHDLAKPFVDAFLAYPFDEKLYIAYLMSYPEELTTIQKMSPFFGVDLSQFISNALNVNGYEFKNLETANYVRNYENEFIKYFDISTGIDFAKQIFTRRFMYRMANNNLLNLLIKRYNDENVLNINNEEIIGYKKHMANFYGNMTDVPYANDQEKIIQLRYCEGEKYYRVALYLLLWEIYLKKVADFANDAVKDCIYVGSTHPDIEDEWFPNLAFSQYAKETDYLFAYYDNSNGVEECIVASSYGLETSVTSHGEQKQFSSSWSKIESISFKKDFIGSSLIIDKQVVAHCIYIGRDMELIVQFLKCLQMRELNQCVLQDVLRNIVRNNKKYMFYLAEFYSCDNPVVSKDLSKAKFWYKKYLDTGESSTEYESAKERLSSTDIMNAKDITEEEALAQYTEVIELTKISVANEASCIESSETETSNNNDDSDNTEVNNGENNEQDQDKPLETNALNTGIGCLIWIGIGYLIYRFFFS